MLRPNGPWHLAWISLAATGLLACGTPSSKLPLEQLAAIEQEQARGEAHEAVSPLPIERPSDLLPPEVGLMVELLNPTSLFDLSGPLDNYPEINYARALLREHFGQDLIDPAQWDQLGIDRDGPAGMGVLDSRSGSFFFYLSLTELAPFERTLERFVDLAGTRSEFSVTEVAKSRVYRIGPGTKVVVRDQFALLIVSDRPDEAPRDYVMNAATIDPRESLGHSEKFVWAREQLQASDDVMLFLSPPALLQQSERDEPTGDDYGLAYAEDQLARARAAGEPAEAIRQLEARVAEERRWQREREARDVAERELFEALVNSVAAFVGAADLRQDGIVGHARASIPGPSLLRRLFLPPSHESPLLSALNEPSLFALDGRVDVQVLLELLELLARADGHTLDSLNSELLADTGIDLLAGVIPALSGEGGLMLTEARKPDVERLGEVRKSLGLAGYAVLKDPEAMRQLLDNIARAKLLSGMLVRAKRGDAWLLRVPKWHELELAIVGERLVVSTDRELATRIRNAERGTQADALAQAEHPLRGPLPNPALRIYSRMLGFALLEAREPWRRMAAESMISDFDTHPQLTPAEAGAVPRSREYKRKLAELEKIVDQLDAHELRRAQRDFERELEFAARLGDLGLQIEPLSDGLAFAGHWRFAPGTTLFELGSGYFRMVASDDDDSAEQDRLTTHMSELLVELHAIRRADLDAAAAKRRR